MQGSNNFIHPPKLLTLTLLLSGLPAAAVSGADQRDYVLRSNSNLVVLDVSVTSLDGSPVSGLSKSRFAVAEDGRKQEIKQFSSAESPVSIGVVVDASGSMANKVADVRHAVRLLVEASRPHDEYFVTGFNDRVQLVLPPTRLAPGAKAANVEAAIGSLRMAGRTSLYDGVQASLTHLGKSVHERRVLVLISDGHDTASRISRSDLLSLVRGSAATIYTVGLYFEDSLDERDSGLLRAVARISGGRFYHPASAGALKESCLEIARDIRTRYTIAYVPREPERAAIRKIQVDLVRTPQDSRKLKVRTRREYRIGDNSN